MFSKNILIFFLNCPGAVNYNLLIICYLIKMTVRYVVKNTDYLYHKYL